MIKSIIAIISISILSWLGFNERSKKVEMLNNNYPTYEALWKQVQEQEEEGKPKSALELVEKIYKQAKQENNSPQIYKALMFQSKYTMTLEENSELTIANRFKEEIKNADVPTKQLLQSSLAELYWQYYNANRWQFNQRTGTDGGIDDNDFRTWDLPRLFEETSKYYNLSLQNETTTQAAKIGDFQAILNQSEGAKDYEYLRPSLYDLLIHRAIDFYKNDQSGLTKPAYQFVIKNPQAFGSAKDFLNYKPITKDSLSNELKTIELYQHLIAYHQKQDNTDAFIQANIDRLEYVYEKAKIENKDELYEKALKALLKQYKKNATVAMAGYELGNIYARQGNKYNPENNPENQWKLKEAIEIYNNVIEQYPNSLGAINSASRIASIKNFDIGVVTESEFATNTPFRTKIEYKNLDNIYFRIAKVNEAQINTIHKLYREERAEYLQKLKPISSWQSTTPNVGDYQRHSYEEMANNKQGLPNGVYIILASSNEEFSTKKETEIGFAIFQVTDIAYYKKKVEKGVAIYVKDRTTGKPIPNATVSIKSKKGSKKYSKTVTADKNGVATFSIPNKKYYSLGVFIKANGQKAEFGNFYYNHYPSNNNDDVMTEQSIVFTDRSIYRPGQTIYFKGVSFASSNEKSEILANKAVRVILRDANYQEVETLELKTNQYGSVQGSFVIPRGRMLGRYQINYNDNSYSTISVEEYKRPKFAVKLDTLKGNYKLGDKIKAEGEAKAFSGAVVSNAKVNYRVVRNVQYPYWRYWRPQPRKESMEITNGTTNTNHKGRFEIPFTAIADPSTSLSDNPQFTYTIYADVTDINGETRSTSSVVTIGTIAMNLQIQAKSEMIDAEKNQVSILTKNLNGSPLSAKANVAIYKLTAPSKPLTSRLWSAPDQFGLEKDEFKRYFPNEPFNKQEENIHHWESGKKVLSKTVTTNAETGKADISIKTKKWKAGFYRVEVNSKDKFGKDVKQTSTIEIIDQKAKKVSDNQFFIIKTNKNTYEPNETAKIKIGTALNNLEVLVEIVRDEGEIIHTERLRLSNEIKTISVPIKENYRGGIVVYYTFVKHNRFFNGEKTISIPHYNKNLNIEVKTFRDKLQPNQKETWTFTVKGDKAEKVNAEFLASLYDASLDEFKPHRWDYYIPMRTVYGRNPFDSDSFSTSKYCTFMQFNKTGYRGYAQPVFYHLNFFGMNLGYTNYNYGGVYFEGELESVEEVAVRGIASPRARKKAMKMEAKEVAMAAAPMARAEISADAAQVNTTPASYSPPTPAPSNQQPTTTNEPPIKARKNLKETAFFFPQLTTDKEGNVSFTFTTPEALTKWNFMAFAHTKDLKTGTYEGSTITQKELMVTPNAPRFFREGDLIIFSSKISNISKKALSGEAELVLLDATTMQPVYNKFGAVVAKQNFTVNAEESTNIDWTLTIPDNVPAVTYRVLAKAGNFSDGEENALPVLSNRQLVTESMPIALRSNQTKTFTFNKLVNNNSSTLKNHKLTFEMTSNPAWYAVQSLPYLMEYPYECSEQIFSRYYANSLATHIANDNPKIQSVFNTWKNYQPDALKSNLEKNEELKSLLIRETPWVREAQSEAEQKRRIALLFDLNKMASEQEIALNTLQERQLGNGGWAWFPGGRANRYISQHIVAGFGHLDRLNVKQVREDKPTWKMTEKAVRFLDNELRRDFEDLKRHNPNWKETTTISQLHVHYFYTRSFFKDVPVANRNQKAYDFYFNLLKKDWLSNDLYRSGLSALALHRYEENELAQKIMTSLDEKSITSEELGMYWKSNTAGYFWYQAPIETQALMIEAFDEVANNQKAVDELKVWLLKNKQTNSWESTKATAEAVYALLLRGGDWLAIDDVVEVSIANKPLNFNKIDGVQAEAGTGYVKTSWNGKEITPEMGNVTATKKGDGIAWGAMYWQYFEDLDKITTHKTPLQLKKQLFLQQNSDKGLRITPITDGQTVQVGDLLKVRIELRVDRDMEFVHMKDMRAAGFEPTNVLSQYKWQDGLGYYESTKDASTDFFFDYLPKGVYVFEYPLRVNNAGDFSNGITTIQCMYAPEFTSHSEGVRVKVKR